jgi:hypothetical protein
LVGIGIGDILSETFGMLRSRQGFGFRGKQRSKGSDGENFDFDEMDATRFTNGHTLADGGSNSELRAKSQPWRPTMESLELRQRSECETRGAAGIRHRSAPRSLLGTVSGNAEPAMV